MFWPSLPSMCRSHSQTLVSNSMQRTADETPAYVLCCTGYEWLGLTAQDGHRNRPPTQVYMFSVLSVQWKDFTCCTQIPQSLTRVLSDIIVLSSIYLNMLSLFKFKIHFMRMNVCLHMYLCSVCIPGAHRNQKTASDSLGPELQMVMSCHISARNQTWVPWNSSHFF